MKVLSLLTILGLLSCQSIAANQQTEEARPNVLLIMADDLNDYQGSFGGHPQAITPNIDRLARMAVQFENAQNNAPVCSPSRNSLFTGVYPHDSKDFGWERQHKQQVLKHNKPIQLLFRENGYQTYGTGKLMHGGLPKLWDQWGLKRQKAAAGPFYFNGEKLVASSYVPSPFSDIGPIDGSFGPIPDVTTNKKGESGWVLGNTRQPLPYDKTLKRGLHPDELQANWAVDRLNDLAKQNQPFFMGIGFSKPHTPLHAPQAYFDMYPLESLKLAPWMQGDKLDTYYERLFPQDIKGLRYYRTLLASYRNNRELALKTYLQAYLACVTFMDAQLGKVLDALEQKPTLNNNTVIVFTSDHGWQMGEKDFVFKNSPWEETARVPLLIKTTNPKDAGKKVQQPVSLVDLYPTLMDVASLKGDNRLNNKGAELGGHSLTSLISRPDGSTWSGPEGALTIVGNAFHSTNSSEVNQQHYSYRTNKYRYIRYSDGNEELYDHDTDPYEWHNIARDNKAIVKSLKKQIEQIVGTAL